MAERLGKELAHRDPTLLEKSAFVGTLATAAGKFAPQALSAGRGAAKTMMRSPGKALALGGAGAGAAVGGLSNPGYDAQGNKNSRLGGALTGAAVGAGLGFGASKIPGAGKLVQQGGQALSKNIRGFHHQNLAGPLGRPKPALAAPAAGGAAAGVAPAPAGPQQLSLKLAGMMDMAKGVAANPLARRAVAGGAVGGVVGGEDNHASGALAGGLLAGAGGSLARRALKAVPAATAAAEHAAPAAAAASHAAPAAGRAAVSGAREIAQAADGAPALELAAATPTRAQGTMAPTNPTAGRVKLSPLTPQRQHGVPDDMVARMRANAAGVEPPIGPALPGDPDGFGPAFSGGHHVIDPHAATMPGAGPAFDPTQVSRKTVAGVGRPGTSVTRIDPIAQGSVRALRADA
jgi:hypothetical protein